MKYRPKIALVGVRYQFNAGVPDAKVSQSISLFFERLTDRLSLGLDDEGNSFELLDIDDIYTTDQYREMVSSQNPTIDFVPYPYKFPDLKHDPNAAAALCEKLNVKAVFTFQVREVTSATNNVGLVAEILGFNERGTLIASERLPLGLAWLHLQEKPSLHPKVFEKDRVIVQYFEGEGLDHPANRKTYEVAFNRMLSILMSRIKSKYGH